LICAEILNPTVERLAIDDTARVAARKLWEARAAALPVCDWLGRVLGTVSEHALSQKSVHQLTLVFDLMEREVHSCRPNDDVHRAEQLMRERGKSRILCVDDTGRLLGIIQLADIPRRTG
jgi:CBS-domain-containing membrane protein